jgi:Flp pilus assembly protein TadD
MRTNGYLSPVCLCRVIVIGLLLSSVGCNASNGWAMNRSGMRQYQRGQYAQARHRFARAVAHDPYNADYRHNLAMSLQKQGDVAASEKILRHNLTINAMHQPTYHSLAH